MRRTTLGPVPGNAMNSRLSMAGPPARRQSEMPSKRKSSIRRKSSLGARKSGVGTDRRQMKDPRPIKDKKFKADSAMSVIAYLTEFGAYRRRAWGVPCISLCKTCAAAALSLTFCQGGLGFIVNTCGMRRSKISVETARGSEFKYLIARAGEIARGASKRTGALCAQDGRESV